jgi:hypothetical protein
VVGTGIGVTVGTIVDVNVFVGERCFGISVELLIVAVVPLVIGVTAQEAKTNTTSTTTIERIAFMLLPPPSCLDYSIGYYRKFTYFLQKLRAIR